MSEARCSTGWRPRSQASLLRESTERVGRFRFVHALINHTLYRGWGRLAVAACTTASPRRSRSCTAGSGEHVARAGAALAAWRRPTGRSGRLLAARRGGARSTASLRRRRRSCSPTRSTCSARSWTRQPVRGADRARRGAAADGRSGVPRRRCLHAARIASALGDADLAAACGAREHPRLLEPASATSTTSGSGRSSARSSSTTRRAGPARAAVVALSHRSWRLRARPHPAASAGRRGDRARPPGVRSADAGDGNRKLRATPLAPDTLARRSERVRELTALVAQVGDLQIEFVCQDPGADRGDRARRFRTGGRDARTGSGDRRAGTAADAAMERGLHRRLAGVPRGELEASERLAEQVLQLGQEAGQPDAVMIYGATIVQIRQVQGRGRR